MTDGTAVGAPRVMIVDDSVVVRRMVARALERHGAVEVVGTAVNGRDALVKLGSLHPDLLILDLEMPEMNGIQTLQRLRRTHADLPVIVFSHLTAQGAASTMEALAHGATAFALKPTAQAGLNEDSIRSELLDLIQALVRPAPRAPVAPSAPPARRTGPVDAIVIGVSTGGPTALVEVIGGLPADLPVPVLVVQHMPAQFTPLLARRLDRLSEISVVEATDGDEVAAGQVYLAPGGRHLAVARTDGGVTIDVHDGPAENWCRPAADVLFRAAAAVWGGGVLAVVMTGMGHDGLRGAEAVRAVGGAVIAQSPSSSVVASMPAAVADAGLADEIVALDDLADALTRRIGALR